MIVTFIIAQVVMVCYLSLIHISEPTRLAGSERGDIILDPFMGSGTTGMVAKKHGRNYIGCELHEDYASLQTDRIDSIPSQLVL